jgi:O-antigen/teichoic acid export membrane protein
MLKVKNLLNKNNILLGLAVLIKFLAVLFGLLINRWVNTYLSPETLKEYNLITSYTPIILGFIIFGIPTLIQKNYTNINDKEKLKDVWATFFYLRIASYFIGLIIIILTFRLSRTDDLMLILGIFTTQFILLADLNYRSVCDVLNQTWKFSITDVLGKILLVLAIYSAVFFRFPMEGILIFIYSSVFSYLIAYILDYFWNKKNTEMGKFSLEILKENYKPILYLSFSSLFFFGSVDKQLLDFYGVGAFELNGYTNAFKVFDIALIIPSMIIPVFASRAKKHFDLTHEKSEKRKILKRWLILTFLAGLLISFCVFIFSRIIFDLIDPKSIYTDSSLKVMPLFCVSLFCYFSSFFYYNINVFFHKEKQETIIQILNSISFVSLYVLLIPNFGIVGAAMGHMCIYLLDFIRRTINFTINKNNFL